MSNPGATDRRRAHRHIAAVPIQEAPEGKKPRTAMIRELSVSGAQILTQSKREVGSGLTLHIFFDPESPRVVDARVVRTERREEDAIWRWLTVVEFASPLIDLEEEIAELADQQEKVFGPRSRPPPAD